MEAEYYTRNGPSGDLLDSAAMFSDFQNCRCKLYNYGVFMLFFGCNLWMENYRGAYTNTMDVGIFMKSALSLYVGLDQGYLTQRMAPLWAMHLVDWSPRGEGSGAVTT